MHISERMLRLELAGRSGRAKRRFMDERVKEDVKLVGVREEDGES